MDQKTAQQLNDRTSAAAFKIVRALAAFENEPPHIRQQAEQLIMHRVQQMRNGVRDIVEGDHLVKEILEPVEPAPDVAGSEPEPPAP